MYFLGCFYLSRVGIDCDRMCLRYSQGAAESASLAVPVSEIQLSNAAPMGLDPLVKSYLQRRCQLPAPGHLDDLQLVHQDPAKETLEERASSPSGNVTCEPDAPFP
ncbi:hypothetical protein BGZ58_006441 [Dissophora ornata]|nr:hypothetical protein BGZ58_006441 [Dissophora ornata]